MADPSSLFKVFENLLDSYSKWENWMELERVYCGMKEARGPEGSRVPAIVEERIKETRNLESLIENLRQNIAKTHDEIPIEMQAYSGTILAYYVGELDTLRRNVEAVSTGIIHFLQSTAVSYKTRIRRELDDLGKKVYEKDYCISSVIDKLRSFLSAVDDISEYDASAFMDIQNEERQQCETTAKNALSEHEAFIEQLADVLVQQTVQNILKEEQGQLSALNLQEMARKAITQKAFDYCFEDAKAKIESLWSRCNQLSPEQLAQMQFLYGTKQMLQERQKMTDNLVEQHNLCIASQTDYDALERRVEEMEKNVEELKAVYVRVEQVFDARQKLVDDLVRRRKSSDESSAYYHMLDRRVQEMEMATGKLKISSKPGDASKMEARLRKCESQLDKVEEILGPFKKNILQTQFADHLDKILQEIHEVLRNHELFLSYYMDQAIQMSPETLTRVEKIIEDALKKATADYQGRLDRLEQMLNKQDR